MERAPAYWSTRIPLAVGLLATAIVVAFPLLALAAPQPIGPLFDRPPAVLGLTLDVVLWLAAAMAAVCGLVWMLRIFRGPRDGTRP